MNYKKAACKSITYTFIVIIFIAAFISEHKVSAADNTVEYEDGFSYSKINSRIKKRINGRSYKKNSDISLDDLRYVYELYEIRYPIRRMELIDGYDADDNLSMEADNTSCFNYRKIAGSSNLSMHALGLAIDINPRVNPCVGGAHGILPANGKVYRERDVKLCKGSYKKIMIHKNDRVYKIFKSHGFSWGGDWHNMKDYQHFYKVPKKYKNSGKYSW